MHSYPIKIVLDRFSNETNDCTVRAISNAFRVPYAQAHATLKAWGRKERRGIQFSKFMEQQNSMLYNKRFVTYGRPRQSLKTFVATHQTGEYIVNYKGHVLAVVDGVVLDSFASKDSKSVLAYWEINPQRLAVTSMQKQIKQVAPRGKLTQREIVTELAKQLKTIDQIVEETGIKKANVAWYFSKHGLHVYRKG